MKRPLALLAVLAVCAAALYFAQRRPRNDAVSANALLDVAAGWQRDATRVPLHYIRISDVEETQIGTQLAASYETADAATTPEQRALEQYVNQIGHRVAAHAKRQLTWHFHLLCDPNFINAFALPGGQIFIGTGLLDQLKSEDELAFVLGHEIEHVDHYHPVERVQVEARLRHLDLGRSANLRAFPSRCGKRVTARMRSLKPIAKVCASPWQQATPRRVRSTCLSAGSSFTASTLSAPKRQLMNLANLRSRG